eukprot:5930108-Amphidinium_carterae.4
MADSSRGLPGGEFEDASIADLYIYPATDFHEVRYIRPRSELQRLEDWLASWPLKERERVVEPSEPNAKRQKNGATESASSSAAGWMHDLPTLRDSTSAAAMDKTNRAEADVGDDDFDDKTLFQISNRIRKQMRYGENLKTFGHMRPSWTRKAWSDCSNRAYLVTWGRVVIETSRENRECIQERREEGHLRTLLRIAFRSCTVGHV